MRMWRKEEGNQRAGRNNEKLLKKPKDTAREKIPKKFHSECTISEVSRQYLAEEYV